MSLIARARSALARAIAPKRSRAFAAAQAGRLFSDWIASATSGDAEIRASIRRLIDRSRSLERDNDYQRGFLGACDRNINGAVKAGNDLRMDCGEYVYQKGKAPRWQKDEIACNLIQNAWAEWSKKGACTVCGKYSYRSVKRLLVRGTARDGNFIARKVTGKASGNRFGFALQLWEIDHLDLNKFETNLKGGGEIRFGIETNAMKRPVAYWLMARHPGDLNGGGGESRSLRFPASEIYHVALDDRAEQTIGYPWIVSAITRLRQLGAFEEAATIAARLGASNAIFFETDPNSGSGWSGDTMPDGRAVMDVEPGSAQELPAGWKVANHTPPYPNIETGDFRKAMLRGVGTSVGVSYNTLGNDLESVNFSSARVGLFEEREMWKSLQLFYDENFNEPVFADWLEQSILSGAIALPLAKFAKFNRPVFKNRRWPFIDPAKELDAARTGIALRLTSRRQVIEESGGDVEDVFHDNLDDENLAEEIGLSLSPPDPEPESVGELKTDDSDDTEPKDKKPLPKK